MHEDPGDGCYGCWSDTGYRSRHDSYFVDTRTGRQFCHHHAEALISWELDIDTQGIADLDPDLPYPDWINEAVENAEAPG